MKLRGTADQILVALKVFIAVYGKDAKVVDLVGGGNKCK